MLLLALFAAPARAELPQPSCEALATWTEGFERREGWAPNELGLGGRDRFNALFADPRTAALFGKPVLDWTPEEAKALAPHFAACADTLRRGGNREASGVLGTLRIQAGREVPNYLAALAEARAAVPRTLGELAQAAPSVALVRFLEAAAAIGTEADAATQANRAASGLSGPARNDARALMGALRDIPQAEVAALIRPAADGVPALRTRLRQAAAAELEEVPATLAGLQMLERRGQQLLAEYSPALGEAETRALQAAVAARRTAIGAALRDELLGQVAAAPGNIVGAQMLVRIQQQLNGQYAQPLGAEGAAAVNAALRAKRAEVGAALVQEILAGIASLPPQPASLRSLQQLETLSPNPAFFAAVGPEGMREITTAAAAKRTELGTAVAAELRGRIGAVPRTPEGFGALDQLLPAALLDVLPAEAATSLKQDAAAQRARIAEAALPGFRAELARLPASEEGLETLDRTVLPGVAALPASAAAEKERFAAVAQERRAAILAALNRAEAGPLRGRIYEGEMVKIEFLDRTRVVITAPGAPPVPGTYTEEADGRVSITAGQIAMVMTREGKRLVAGPVTVRRVK
ncbi:hypothetical protein [Falsiroseomonas bella]|uniref:hypothetical protein n=1 Tax=Falsiroseomonas bella TaxID=2184016 RepID=UPI001304BCE9|nr:hypothetical protein [Falsiroseomonas bella]